MNQLKFELYLQEADIMGGALLMSSDRMEAMDFTPAINVADHTMMVKYPTLEPDIAGFVKPFTINVREPGFEMQTTT